MGLLKTMTQDFVDNIIPAVVSYLLAKLGVPGMHLQFIACGLLFVMAVCQKLSKTVSTIHLAPAHDLEAQVPQHASYCIVCFYMDLVLLLDARMHLVLLHMTIRLTVISPLLMLSIKRNASCHHTVEASVARTSAKRAITCLTASLRPLCLCCAELPLRQFLIRSIADRAAHRSGILQVSRRP